MQIGMNIANPRDSLVRHMVGRLILPVWRCPMCQMALLVVLLCLLAGCTRGSTPRRPAPPSPVADPTLRPFPYDPTTPAQNVPERPRTPPPAAPVRKAPPPSSNAPADTPAAAPSLQPHTPLSTPSPTDCCRICHQGKPCGDTCLADAEPCYSPPGCACAGH
jgi:hypothetical protein